jgi:sugar phosphate isomerase/epimerase
LDRITKGGAKEYRSLVKKHGLEISSLSTHLEGQLILGPHDSSTDEWFKGSPEEKQKYGIERLKKTIDAASALEVPVVNSFTGVPEWGKWYVFPPKNEEIFESYFKLFAEKWSPVLDYAKDHNVKIAFETHPQELNYNLETAKSLLKSVNDHPALGFNYDPSHLIWQQMDPAQFIYELGQRIFHVHAKDVEVVPHSVSRTGILVTGPWNRMARAVRFRTIGWGNVPWNRVITALLETGYNYVMSVEHEDPCLSRDSGVELAVSFLKPLLKAQPPETKPWW